MIPYLLAQATQPVEVVVKQMPRDGWAMGLSIVALVISFLALVGTLLITFFQEKINRYMRTSHLTLWFPDSPDILIGTEPGYLAWFYVVGVKTTRGAPATSCIIKLIKVEKRDASGQFVDMELPSDLPLKWAVGRVEEAMTVRRRPQRAYLCCASQEDPKNPCPDTVVIALQRPRMLPHGGHVHAGDVVRYHLIADAENGYSNELVVEIYWDGKWSAHKKEMAEHLQIKDVTADALAEEAGR